MTLVEQHTANNTSPELDFTTCISSTYDDYVIKAVNLVPATNATNIKLQMSTDGGATYDSGANYTNRYFLWFSGGTQNNGGDNDGIDIALSPANSNFGFNSTTTLQGPQNAAADKGAYTQNIVFDGNASAFIGAAAWGAWSNHTAVNAFRVITGSGNLKSGTVRCYGVAK